MCEQTKLSNPEIVVKENLDLEVFIGTIESGKGE